MSIVVNMGLGAINQHGSGILPVTLMSDKLYLTSCITSYYQLKLVRPQGHISMDIHITEK